MLDIQADDLTDCVRSCHIEMKIKTRSIYSFMNNNCIRIQHGYKKRVKENEKHLKIIGLLKRNNLQRVSYYSLF